jgi:hypothetical protein
MFGPNINQSEMPILNVCNGRFVLPRLDVGIVGSNPTRGMDVYIYMCVRLFYVCVVLWR